MASCVIKYESFDEPAFCNKYRVEPDVTELV